MEFISESLKMHSYYKSLIVVCLSLPKRMFFLHFVMTVYQCQKFEDHIGDHDDVFDDDPQSLICSPPSSS